MRNSAAAGMRPLSEVVAGSVSGLVCLPIGLACGILAFAPLGEGYAAVGAAAGLYGAIIVAFVTAALATSSYVISTARVSMALVQAGLAVVLLKTHGLSPVAAATGIILCLFLAGVLQVLFGLVGLARIIRYTPQTVITGLLNGVGILIIVSQIKPFVSMPSSHLTVQRPLELIYAMAIAALIVNYQKIVTLLGLKWLLGRLPAIIAGLLIGTAVYYAALHFYPLDLGPTIGTISLAFPPSLVAAEFVGFAQGLSVGVLIEIAITSAVLAVLATIESLLAFKVAQSLSDIEFSSARDLSVQGLGNIAASVVGGVGGSAIPSVLVVAYQLGGRTRLTGIISAATIAAIAFLGPQILQLLPKSVFTGILLVIGWVLFDHWNIQLLRNAFGSTPVGRRARYDLLVVLLVMVATVAFSIVAGVITGAVLASLVFVISMSKPLVRRRFAGGDIASKRVRSRRDIETLNRTAAERVTLQLEGPIFFGNVDDLLTELKRALATADYVLLDMHRVADIDVSAARSIATATARAAAAQKHIVFCSLYDVQRAVLLSAFGNDKPPVVMNDLDAALEWLEQRILTRSSGAVAGSEQDDDVEVDLLSGLHKDEQQELLTHCEYREFAEGATLCRQGEAGDRLWLIQRGSVSVFVTGDDGQSIQRIAGLGRGTTVGEMSLVDGNTRSASIIADEEVACFELRRSEFEKLSRDNPALARGVLANLARELSRRLRRTSQDLRLARE
jgi:SulP family sulfate permease